MTCINVVPVQELTQKHLLAEYRELPRIFGLVRKAIERGERPINKRNPSAYTLGTGHVRFFYPRLGWLLSRQKALVTECIRRGYNIQHTEPDNLVTGIPTEWIGSWTPTEEAARINRERIEERLK